MTAIGWDSLITSDDILDTSPFGRRQTNPDPPNPQEILSTGVINIPSNAMINHL